MQNKIQFNSRIYFLNQLRTLKIGIPNSSINNNKKVLFINKRCNNNNKNKIKSIHKMILIKCRKTNLQKNNNKVTKNI